MIEVRQVSHRYADGRVALENVSLTLTPGQFVGLVGPNGSGKSTLARHLNGLLLPSEGEVLVDELSTRGDLVAIRQRVGMVFQNPESQLVAPLVEDDVAFGPENLGLPPAEVRRRVEEALTAVGLQGFRRHEPALLSGGQKQRLALAGVLASRPQYLVLDEPTTMLDPQARHDILAILRGLGLTLILITHRLEELEGADRLIALEGGRVVADGSPGEVWPQLDYGPPVAELARRLNVAAHSEEELRRAVGPGLAGTPSEQPVRPALLRLERVSHRYLPGTPFASDALAEVSLEVRQGECLGLVGTTGSGKTTLALHLNGLLTPQAGRFQCEGLRLPQDVLKLRQRVGLLMQFPEHQLFEEDVAAELSFGPRNFGRPVDPTAALARVGLAGLDQRRSPLELSGGEKRLVALASVLASQPEVVVLDEPTAGLDHRARGELLQRLRDWKAEGMTQVVISHDIEELALLADRVAVLQGGRVAAVGPLRELVEQGLVPPPLSWRIRPGALTPEELVA